MPSTPHIVFLDAATVNLGDLDLSSLRGQGVYHESPEGLATEDSIPLRQAQIFISNKIFLGEREFERFPNLKLVCVAATGVNNVELKSAERRGVAVCNVAGYSTTTVVEHTLMFLLALSHRLVEHREAVFEGAWTRTDNFAVLDYPYRDLSGKTLGILGYGHIGRRVAELASLLGMRVLLGEIPGRDYSSATPEKFPRFNLKTLLPQVDFLSLHCPLDSQTRHLLDAEKLGWMRPGAYLLNLARGPIVDEQAVARALRADTLAGYASDVLEVEPMPAGHVFLDPGLSSKILLSPHIAWASRESRQRLLNEIALNIAAYRRGERRNRIV